MDWINLFPPEILTHIFKLLPLKDRKNIRLTCRQWNEACNHSDIIDCERFIFHFGYDDDLKRIARFIVRCRTLRRDIEFLGLHLRTLPDTVWEQCGARIKSLFIRECTVNNRTIRNIILHCSNLKIFRVESKDPKKKSFCSEYILDDLIKSKVERKNLFSFNLHSSYPISIEQYQKILRIYPCIRTFGLGSSCARSRLHYVNTWTLLPRPNYVDLELPSTIENFTCKEVYSSKSMLTFSEKSNLRFKELNLKIHPKPDFSDFEVFYDFFSNQTELERLKLRIDGVDAGTGVETLFFTILKSSPKLKELKFRYWNSFKFNSAEFSEFLSGISRLIRLELHFSQWISETPRPTELPSVRYTKLKNLRLNSSGNTDERIFREILNRCDSLRSLTIDSVGDRLLKEIFKNQSKLRILKIRCNDEDCSKAGFIGNEYSFSRLRNLEFLEVHGLGSKGVDTVYAFLTEFNFPRLKYLFVSTMMISLRNAVNEQFLKIVATKAPCLEFLRLDFADTRNADKLTDYCSRLEELKVIGELYVDQANCSSLLFKKCHTLRYIISSRKYLLYYYDRCKQKLKVCNDWYLFLHYCSDKIYNKLR